MKLDLKKMFLALMLSVAALSSVFYLSCNRNTSAAKCQAIVCGNGGVCNNGICTCPPGYEDATCGTVTSSKYTGTWVVQETGTVTTYREYTLAIATDPANVDGLLINNFYNFFITPIRATLNMDTITIPNQQYQGMLVFGKGYIYSDSLGRPFHKLVLQYEVIDSSFGNKIVDDFGYYSSLDHSKGSTWAKTN